MSPTPKPLHPAARAHNLHDQESPTLTEYKEAIMHTPKGDPDLPAHLQNLATYFGERYQKLGHLQDLENALDNFRAAADLLPAGHPDLSSCLHDMALSLSDRFLRLGNIADLEEALKNNHAAVNLAAADDPDRDRYLQSLGACLRDRYKRFGHLDDLEAALKYKKAAVRLAKSGDPELPGRLQNLAVSFSDRYSRFGQIEDLDAALENYQAALARIPRNHPELPGYLQSVGFCLTDRYHRLGDLTDLEAAVARKKEAVKLTRRGHPFLPERLHSLAAAYIDRYRRLGDPADIYAALNNCAGAVASTPTGHPAQSKYLKNLAIGLRDLHQRFRAQADIDMAIQRIEEAIQATPPNDPDLGDSLHCLALCHRARYMDTRKAEDLQSAMESFTSAVERTSEGHPGLVTRLHGLSVALRYRYEMLGDVSELEMARKTNERAISLTPPDHPDLAVRIHDLVACLICRYQKFGDPGDMKSALSNCRKSFNMTTSQPMVAWGAALKWAAFAQEQNEPAACLEAYTSAFRLLPQILWVGNPLSAQQFATRTINIVRATSQIVCTCIDLSDLPLAVELLEQGLATTFQQMLQLKTNSDGLPPKDANRLEYLSSQLYSGMSDNPKALATEREELLNIIRKRPGLEYFLLPKPYAQLRQVASEGPVVILNAHQDHCDAIILIDPTANPVHVALPGVTLTELEQQRSLLADLIRGRDIRARGPESTRLDVHREGARSTEEWFGDMLNWLWSRVVSCIYAALDSRGKQSGRLWWCPIGAFVGIPLHAAAPSDKFIQSYTSTLGGLLDARLKKYEIRGRPTVGIVGVTHIGPNREAQLPAVPQEIAKIVSIFGPRQVQKLVDDKATVEAVKVQLQTCAWIHLACHGHQDDQDPPKSHLKLYGGDLELGTILRMALTSQFVFLSACQTAMGGMGDARMANEAFHLAGGFVAAGFRGAIGTMWSIMDEDGPGVAESVYTHLFADGATLKVTDAAKALQLATRKMRDERVGYERWVPFIHIGI
ncbi:CHAT domain-containing protein [Mycena rosella]|uniref:CHAT domain-containing protein n=1 Tax=Mycena rosella TaxID=1033263 RepID=A0AAD7G8X6_MYCRO|nr:CHAT domain-containing protein [Mycena rosella]